MLFRFHCCCSSLLWTCLYLIKKKRANINTKCEVILTTDTNISYGVVNDICKCKDNVAYGTEEGSNSMYEVICPANLQQNETVYESLEQAKIQPTFSPDPSYQTAFV